VNDGKQHEDSNNIIKYLDFNKDKILNLAKKNYENLVEALANNAINTAAAAAAAALSNLPSSLPQ